MAIMAGIDGRLWLGYTENAVTFTTAPTVGNVARTIYQITLDSDSDYTYDPNHHKRFWDPNTDVLVYVGGVLQTSGYTAYRSGGVIEFDSALGAGSVVTVSGKYIPMTAVATAKSISFDLQTSNEDVTTFNVGASSNKWGKNSLTMKQGSGSIEVMYDAADADEWHDAMFGDVSETPDWTGGAVMGIQFGPYTGAWQMYMLAFATGLQQQSAATGIATETINFMIANDAPYFKV